MAVDISRIASADYWSMRVLIVRSSTEPSCGGAWFHNSSLRGAFLAGVTGPQMKKSATNIKVGAQNRRSHVGLGVFISQIQLVFASCGAPERCDSTWVCGPEWSAASGGWCYGSSSAYGTAAASSGEIRAGNLWGSSPENLLWIWAWAWWAWSTSGPAECPPVRTPRSSPCTARSWRSVSAFTWALPKRVPKANQTVFIRLLGAMTLSSSVPAGVIALGPLLASICLNKSWACPWSLQTPPPTQTHGTSEHFQLRLLSLLETSSFCAHRDHIDCCVRREKTLKH